MSFIDMIAKGEGQKDSEEQRNQCINLLNDFKKDKITYQEMMKDLAYILIECDDIKPKFVGNKPEALQDYESMKREDSQYEVSGRFWHRDEIQSFLNHRDRVKLSNKYNVLTLVKFLQYIPEKDEPTREKYRQKILEFKGAEGIKVKENEYTDKVVVRWEGEPLKKRSVSDEYNS